MPDMTERWRKQAEGWLLESARVKERLSRESAGRLLEAAMAMADCLRSGGKSLLSGNGGSAADCQHIAGELIGRLGPGRDRNPLPAVALTTDSSILTSVGNDYGFEHVFARKVEALGASNDLLILRDDGGMKTLRAFSNCCLLSLRRQHMPADQITKLFVGHHTS